MKLNFWQWLAVVLLIVGCIWWVYDIRHAQKNPPASQPVREDQPA